MNANALQRLDLTFGGRLFFAGRLFGPNGDLFRKQEFSRVEVLHADGGSVGRVMLGAGAGALLAGPVGLLLGAFAMHKKPKYRVAFTRPDGSAFVAECDEKTLQALEVAVATVD